jgi:hypothetical protein
MHKAATDQRRSRFTGAVVVIGSSARPGPFGRGTVGAAESMTDSDLSGFLSCAVR